MSALDIARWQFGMTTVMHFILVPLTIGLAPLIAVMQTIWVVTGRSGWLRATKFFGKLFLINFALGVATGIVQEFQFGMAWSEYSRFVGDVFGAPLALEGLVAFFMESTFLGLWIFGWSRLPKLVHLACIWLVAIGVNASAYFIIAANSWMQHPVGATYNPETGRAELTSIWAVLTNVTTLAAFPHTVAGSVLTAGTFVAAIGGWWMVRSARRGELDLARTLFRPVTVLALWVMIASAAVLFLTGDTQGKLMFKQQPMKMASAESLCHTETGAGFSLLTTGTHNNCDSVQHVITVPKLTSFLATSTFDSTLPGVAEMQQHYEETVGPGDYRPNLFVTYWAFRAMMGWSVGSGALALAGLWLTRRRRMPTGRAATWFSRLCLIALPTPFLANSSGWVFTEMGRQPWVVVPNPTGDPNIHLTVQDAVSGHSVTMMAFSICAFAALYGSLYIVWFVLLRRYTLEGPLDHDDPDHSPPEEDSTSGQLSFAY
ncbi:cytochrome ubiquinol oxidase subunit I [Tsukamurella sp. 8F]|uniref:cytochrome ubiquinol oxidase subunit I n=1 Tax=unclassified Tsukamurella TaxID=2633480 RepID=UPI0023B8CC35|nr:MULTISPECIES: cytochrome ubiquinol oxidase subunit I [unclassified Tsukamurella]MDF0528421.1 cytochrome ubiquinol oxidase subunit I [Tsukamurella sp. 8J]MDF0586246.1 cytochrome ubiquinol oxidase subunit I [Tsukamurella sp. 8F]